MPITLEQSKVGLADKVDQAVIDEFRRESFILDALTFDNAVSPGTGGSTLTYGYERLKTPSLAEGRAINSEYKAGEALKEKTSVDLKVFGGSFEVDRVIEGSAASSEISFQLQEKIKATRNKFHYDFINGVSTKKGDATSFDGLNKLVTGTSTELKPATAIDLSTVENTKTNMDDFVFQLDQWLSSLADKPHYLLMNSKMLGIMKFIAKKMGYYDRTKDDFGQAVETYNGIQMRDMGKYFNGTKTIDCVPTDDATGTTSIYAVTLAMNAVHGVSLQGNKIINTYLPNMTAPGAVKKGEVEMVAAIALKNTKKAGAFRNIKVQPTTEPSEK